ncbi:hypothetical protein A0H81_10687 [Grifola frondosa]|uniref:Uncharacterized protein n=1 Tax=Grifola frondosa TaxID=5627 RepID=A0A1C7M309_GRIFR|nr:hypothetical protein A0H81_10687 [Grifola frondosa]
MSTSNASYSEFMLSLVPRQINFWISTTLAVWILAICSLVDLSSVACANVWLCLSLITGGLSMVTYTMHIDHDISFRLCSELHRLHPHRLRHDQSRKLRCRVSP